ncbi:hypothetical protein MKW92_028859 [Papaver armeniacum]|nr:hypothetical protein MKW92_028859 [Papaver armeniacum]
MNQEHHSEDKSGNYVAEPSCPPLPSTSTGVVSVISPHYCAPYPVDLTIVRKVLKLTHDNYDVFDVNGNIVFTIKDEMTFLHHHRVLRDPAGVPIVTVYEKIKSMHRRFNVFKGDSKDMKDLVFTAKQSHMIQWTTKLDVFLASDTKKDVCDFKVKGNWLERSCTIYAGEPGDKDEDGASSRVIAQMKKKHTVDSVVLGKDTFNVTVYPNIDYAFVIALITVLDAVNDARAES